MTDRKHPLREIFKARDVVNPYMLACVAGNMVLNRELSSPLSRKVDKALSRIALDSSMAEWNYNTESIYSRVNLWHGTGRYQYGDGGVVDVLGSIVEHDSIMPNRDLFDFNGATNSISLAHSRMYARSYADMHGSGVMEPERYGNSLLWACSFLGSVAVEASKHMGVWQPDGYQAMMKHLREANSMSWYRKITRDKRPGILKIFRDGSDIPGNYPVLIGVRSVEPIDTSSAVAVHEVRTDKMITWDDISHIEVPRDNIRDTWNVIGNRALVRAIEDGERFSANYTFSEHIKGML